MVYESNDKKSVNRVRNLIQSNLQTVEGCEISLSRTSEFCEFDLIDRENKVLVEVKSRSTARLQYSTTMVGANKIEKGKKYVEAGWLVLFAFEFTDGIFYHSYEGEELEIRLGGRTDRGRQEIKDYAFLDAKSLIRLDK